MTHKHVLKSFDFTDVEQRIKFLEFIVLHPKVESFLLQVELSKGGSLRGLHTAEVIKKLRRMRSLKNIISLQFFDIDEDEKEIEVSLKHIKKITILKELRNA